MIKHAQFSSAARISTAIMAAVVLPGFMASATLTTWDGSASSDWATGANWDTGNVPNMNGTDDALIANGDTAIYTPGGDLTVENGSKLTITGGSTWQQTPGNWTRFNDGLLELDNGNFTRVGAGNVVLGFNNGTGGIVTMTNGSELAVGGEIWFGRDVGNINQTSTLTLSGGSTVNASGGVGIWFWDTDAVGNNFQLDVIPGLAINNINARVGRRNTGGTNNAITWETLWGEGVLTVNGGNAGVFSDHFTTTGTPGTTGYSLQSRSVVPEPASAALIGFGVLAIGLLRRR